MDNDLTPTMDEADQEWVRMFQSGDTPTVPPDAIIQGFVSVISWMNPDGTFGWRAYNTIDAPLSHVLGLMEMAKFTMLHNNLAESE